MKSISVDPINRQADCEICSPRQIEAVPAGGAIDWVTYYFRDRRLAEQLLRAHRRNVNVSVTLEGNPHISRTPTTPWSPCSPEPRAWAKDFGPFILPPRVPMPGRKMGNPNLHEKLYCFSHPKPVAFIGSFNPSGDDPGGKTGYHSQNRRP